jgi:predicted acetyltransferase
MNLARVLLVCDKSNVGSAKTIIKNGGILNSEDMAGGVEIQRYWIDLTDG